MLNRHSLATKALASAPVILMLLAALTLAGGQAEAAGNEYTMISIPKLRSEWFNRLEWGLQQAGAEFGVKVSQQAPASADEAQQVRLIEDAINQGNNAILVVPNDANSVVPVFTRAQRRGIAIITHESPNQQFANYDVEMIDNVAFGEKALEVMVEAMGTTEGKFVIFVGSLTVPAHNVWADAALDLAKRKYPGLIEVASRFPVAEDQNLARQTALDILTTYPDIKGFLTFGSQGAPGVAQALREKGLVGKVAVVGTPTPNQARQYLKDGSMSAAVLWDPAEAGWAMVYLAKTVLDGRANEIGPDFEIPGLGKPMTVNGNTLIFDRPLIVTKDNVDQYNF